MLSSSPSMVFHAGHTIAELKCKEAFYPNGNRTRVAIVEVL